MLQSIDHINIVVTDIEAMIRFYTELLGLKQSKRVTISGRWIDTTVGLTNSLADVVYLDLPSGPRLELLCYISPEGESPKDLGVSNTRGIRHIAFKVENIDQVVANLKSHAVQFFSEIQTVPDTQVSYAGGLRKRLVYFHDPEGNLLELCEYCK
jgi:catechol 2,3-dioxygenase-like lactoylglutathione lyase family enzyme